MRIHTFGKSAGRQGAVVVGPALVREFLINRSRTLIYSTALPPDQVSQIRWAMHRLEEMDGERASLLGLRMHLEDRLHGISGLEIPRSDSPIVPIVIPGNEEVKAAAAVLQESGFDVRPILAPTVAKGTERLRVILHSFNTLEEIDRMTAVLRAWMESRDGKAIQAGVFSESH